MEKKQPQDDRPPEMPWPERLARDFGPAADVTRQGIATLYEIAATDRSAVVIGALRQWRELIGKATGCDPSRSTAGIARVAKGLGLSSSGIKPEALLFALHTYYAMVVQRLVGRCPRGGTAGQARSGTRADDCFLWYVGAESGAVTRLVDALDASFAGHDSAEHLSVSRGGSDLFKPLYQALFPRALRHELGEYYTPDWLAEHVLDQAGYSGDPAVRLLDPSCGSGTFLVAAIRRIRSQSDPNEDRSALARRILANVVGYDLNPLAVMTARANYLIAIADLLPPEADVEVPVYLCDSILDIPAAAESAFDLVVGNPPWIAWDNLPDDYRECTRPLWERYGLFSLSGNDARHGGAKKDLSMLMLYVAADRYLKPGGRVGLVVTQTLFQTKGAGDGFRRFRLGADGDALGVVRVDDMVAIRPFADAANWTATIVLKKGRPTEYPVPYLKWSPNGDGAPQRQMYEALPIDAAQPGSPWFLRPAGFDTDMARLVGPSDYTAHLGANSGGANGIYWVETLEATDQGVRVRNITRRGKRSVDPVEQVVESDLLYPLVRWSDVTRFRASPSAHLLLAQDVVRRAGIDPQTMQLEYPLTYCYLGQFRKLLESRAAYRRYQGNRAFYSMYNVGTYTVAPIKVVWRRMDRQVNAAVLEPVDDPLLGPRPVVPQETCVLIECTTPDEAHYLCAVLNSAVVGFLVGAHSVCGGKGFGTPSMLDYLRLNRFDADDPRHKQLAACSRQAHQAALAGDVPAEIPDRIDELTAALWELRPVELDAIRSA